MEFQPPADAGSDFFCNVEGDCFRSETECARRHSACTKHGGTVHCFDLDSRGELLEVCHVTAEACAKNHEVETHDYFALRITRSCQPRP